MLNENKHLEEGIKEILGALQDNQQRTHTISVPCLERLVTVSSALAVVEASHSLNIYEFIILYYLYLYMVDNRFNSLPV